MTVAVASIVQLVLIGLTEGLAWRIAGLVALAGSAAIHSFVFFAIAVGIPPLSRQLSRRQRGQASLQAESLGESRSVSWSRL